MSRIYFDSPGGTAEVAGSEQHHMGKLVYDLATGMLDIRDAADADRLLQLVPPGHYLRHTDRPRPGWLPIWAEWFRTAWRVGGEGFAWHGRPVSPLEISLNTDLYLGGNPMRLVARFYGQNEIHAWVDGPNRAWLADLIDEALEAGLLRHALNGRPQGWEGVTALLRSRDDEAVVASYSVSGGFPDRDLAKWNRPAMPDGWRYPRWDEIEWQEMDEGEKAEYFAESVVEDAWGALPESERWTAGMTGLRDNPGRLELRPEDWTGYWFGNGLTVFDINAADMERRLDEALRLDLLGSDGRPRA